MVIKCLVSFICLDGKGDLSRGVVNCNIILTLECRTFIRSSLFGDYTAKCSGIWVYIRALVAPSSKVFCNYLSHLNPIQYSCLIPKFLFLTIYETRLLMDHANFIFFFFHATGLLLVIVGGLFHQHVKKDFRVKLVERNIDFLKWWELLAGWKSSQRGKSLLAVMGLIV